MLENLKYVKAKGIRKIFGLMFRRRQNLLFEFDKDIDLPIHTMFCFYPIIAVWINERDEILGAKLVHPWTFSVHPPAKYRKLLEIALKIKK